MAQDIFGGAFGGTGFMPTPSPRTQSQLDIDRRMKETQAQKQQAEREQRMKEIWDRQMTPVQPDGFDAFAPQGPKTAPQTTVPGQPSGAIGPSVQTPMAPSPAPTQAPPPSQMSLPGGGTVSGPSNLIDAFQQRMDIETQAPQSRAQEIRQEVFTSPLYENFSEQEKRQITHERITGEAKRGIAERIAGKQIVKSLKSQGMTEDEIRREIGATPDMSIRGGLTELKRLQKRRDIQTTNEQTARQSEAITGKANFNEEGQPTNDEGRFVQLERNWSGTGPDPTADPLIDNMNTSQQKNMSELRRKVYDGRARDEDFKRLENFYANAQIKAQRAYNKKLADQAKQAQAAKIKEAKTEEQKQWLENAYDELESRRKQAELWTKAGVNEEAGDNEEAVITQEKINQNYRDIEGIMEAIKNFNTSQPPPAGGTAQPQPTGDGAQLSQQGQIPKVTTPEQFDSLDSGQDYISVIDSGQGYISVIATKP